MKYKDSVGPNQFQHCSSMANLNTDTSFVDTGTLRTEILILTVQLASTSKPRP